MSHGVFTHENPAIGRTTDHRRREDHRTITQSLPPSNLGGQLGGLGPAAAAGLALAPLGSVLAASWRALGVPQASLAAAQAALRRCSGAGARCQQSRTEADSG